MRILFTGATSLAGRLLFASLREAGHEVVGVSRRARPGEPFVETDLEAADVARSLPGASFDALVHFASYVPASESTSTWRECYPRNVLPTARLLEWADGRVGRILLASSCAVYGTEKLYVPTDERHPLRPDTAYGISKYAQEQVAQAFCRPRRLPLVILRLGYVYGPGIAENRFVMSVLRKLQTGEPLRLTNAHTSGLHLIHVEDIARIGEILLRDGHGIYNLASLEHISLYRYATQAAEALGVRAKITSDDAPDAPVTNHYSCPALWARHGLRPEVGLAAGIGSLLGGAPEGSG